MMTENSSDNALYYVVINHEEQYSIWPAGKAMPLGWKSIGDPRIKDECLAYIDAIWMDMRPLSLRVEMSAGAKKA